MKETICINHRKKYDAELFDMINFGLLYVIPLCVMTVSAFIIFRILLKWYQHIKTRHKQIKKTTLKKWNPLYFNYLTIQTILIYSDTEKISVNKKNLTRQLFQHFQHSTGFSTEIKNLVEKNMCKPRFTFELHCG